MKSTMALKDFSCAMLRLKLLNRITGMSALVRITINNPIPSYPILKVSPNFVVAFGLKTLTTLFGEKVKT